MVQVTEHKEQGKVKTLFERWSQFFPHKEEEPALPAAPSTPPAIEDRCIPDAIAELRELVTHCGRVRNIVHMECHPGGVSLSLSAQEREAYYAFQGMYQTAVDNMYAATHALDACLKLKAMYPARR